jgi:hypothetical protein
LPKKALACLRTGIKSTGLKLVQVEMCYDDKIELADRLLNRLYAIEPMRNLYQKRIFSKDEHRKKLVNL